MKESIPVLAVYASNTGAVAKLYGFVESITAAAGIIVSSSQGMPEVSSSIASPIGTPAATGCRFSLESAPNTDLELKYGDTALIVRRQQERFMLFFTAKPASK
jgi:hypothetical protein